MAGKICSTSSLVSTKWRPKREMSLMMMQLILPLLTSSII